MPRPIASVWAPLIRRSIARQAMPIAETEISATWASATNASALPCPKRWSLSAGTAAILTPRRVVMLAITSSAVSARLPSIAVEPVA